MLIQFRIIEWLPLSDQPQESVENKCEGELVIAENPYQKKRIKEHQDIKQKNLHNIYNLL